MTEIPRCVLCDTSEQVRPRRVEYRHISRIDEKQLCKRCSDQLNWRPGARPKHRPRCQAPYGYTNVNGRIVPLKQEMIGVSRILELRRKGLAYDDIAVILNQESVPSRRGGTWWPRAVETIFRREAPWSAKGVTTPRPSRYGYREKNGKVVEDEYEQKVIAWMVVQYKRGASKQWIAEALNCANVPTKRGRNWFPLTVSHVLDRENV